MATEVRLPKASFRSIIRIINKSSIGNANSIRTATYETLKRLNVKRNLTKAIIGIPRGSDQVNIGNIIAWLNKVQVSNKDAIKQVVAIDATAVKRTKGK